MKTTEESTHTLYIHLLISQHSSIWDVITAEVIIDVRKREGGGGIYERERGVP